MVKYSRPKGTNDIYGAKAALWQYVEEDIRKLCKLYGIHEIRTPMYEYTELFRRGVGETSDIVTKEMFSFKDRGGRDYTLRPEGTVNTVRAYIENGLQNQKKPVKLYYISPHFRAERPQKGRYSQFHQFGVEYFGAKSPLADAEIIDLMDKLFKKLSVDGGTLLLNHLGCADDRKRFNDDLVKYLRIYENQLCDTCKERLKTNPLRVLDCKNEHCVKILYAAPKPVDYLCGDCKRDFDEVQRLLNVFGVKFMLDSRLVRGLDYYTGTVFEYMTQSFGALGGGGRYDNLIAEIGDCEEEGAVGFGIGLERLMLFLEEQGLDEPKNAEKQPLVYVGAMGLNSMSADDIRACIERSAKIAAELRNLGISAENDLISRSVKAQLKYANEIGADYVTLIGPAELHSGTVKIKNMSTGEDILVEMGDLAQWLYSRLKTQENCEN